MRKALSYLSHGADDEYVRSDDLSGLDFSLTEMADTLDDLAEDDDVKQIGRRFVASVVDLLDEGGEKDYAVFQQDIGKSPGGGFTLFEIGDFAPDSGTIVEVSDREDNIVFEAEFSDGGKLVATGQVFVEAKYIHSLAVYLRKIAKALTQK